LKTQEASYGTNTLAKQCLKGQRRLQLDREYHNTVSVVSEYLSEAGGDAI
jgi:hypothetical protein